MAIFCVCRMPTTHWRLSVGLRVRWRRSNATSRTRRHKHKRRTRRELGRISMITSAVHPRAGIRLSHHSMSCSSFRDCRSNAWNCFRSAIACLVNTPCLMHSYCLSARLNPARIHASGSVFCRTPPATDRGRRVLAPQRGLASIGPMLRG
jgi:hypothetical protein